MPVVTVERSKLKFGRTRADSGDFTQTFSHKAPFFSWCWVVGLPMEAGCVRASANNQWFSAFPSAASVKPSVGELRGWMKRLTCVWKGDNLDVVNANDWSRTDILYTCLWLLQEMSTETVHLVSECTCTVQERMYLLSISPAQGHR